LAVPLVLHATGVDAGMVAATVSAILGGSVFGDHCSPISDTTIMSSMASSCDHVDHVRTQLPYALFAALVALLVGYLPTALLDSHQTLSMIAGPVIIIVVFRLFGRVQE
jgi:Na+/H+ antiporter NhaC